MLRHWKYVLVAVLAFVVGSAAISSAGTPPWEIGSTQPMADVPKFAISSKDGARTADVGLGGGIEPYRIKFRMVRWYALQA